MNENFFGKYSVFCVFGSVVGCVVVPLIAQVLQQQSMECMILSAIVITLTATHLKKNGNEGSHSKILYREKKSNNHYGNNKKHKSTNTNSNHGHHSNNSSSSNNSYQQHQQYDEQEQEYMQQYEHLRIVEMERRNEEKRQRKLKKREERLKKREEENKKQKELEEKYKALREKRKKQQKENISRTANTPYHSNAFTNYDKYIHNDEPSNRTRRNGLNVVDENCTTKRTSPAYDKSKYSNTTRQRIPRFNNNGHSQSYSFRDPQCYRKSSVTEALSINCSNLSASCSSLSSISSSGSASPPPSTSPKTTTDSSITPAWKTPSQVSSGSVGSTKNCFSEKNTDYRIHKEQQAAWLLGAEATRSGNTQQQPERALKSYSNFRPVKTKSTYNFDSSSLFCSSHGDDARKSDMTTSTTNNDEISSGQQLSHPGREYSLFGSHQFGSSFLKTPII